jgi:hypothetical protein
MRLVKTQGRGGKQTRQMLSELELRGARNTARAMPVVQRIVTDVRKSGDEALRRYAAKLDGLAPQQSLQISRGEMEQAWDATPKTLQAAMETAAGNIRRFAMRQMPKQWSTTAAGLTTGQQVRALGAVGCYVPSGRYPLPSTLLMTVIPAQVAGVERIVVVSPKPAKETLAAAALLGVSSFYRIGGAQAIAALAFGTESIRRVDKIVGPGNWYVTAAKKMVAFDCAIDMLAGPTEIVVTSESGNAVGIASDLVAQAEHDPEALAILITTNEPLARAVVKEVGKRRGFRRRGSRADQPAGPRTSDRRCQRGSRLGAQRRLRIHWPIFAPADGGLRLWPQPYPAYRRCSAGEGRVERDGLFEADYGAGIYDGRAQKAGTGGHHAGQCGGIARPCRGDTGKGDRWLRLFCNKHRRHVPQYSGCMPITHR